MSNTCQAVRHEWQLLLHGGKVVDAEPHFYWPLTATEIRDRDWCSRCLPHYGEGYGLKTREEYERWERDQINERRKQILTRFRR